MSTSSMYEELMPGIARRPLLLVIAADSSGSMATNGKLQAMNHAAREMVPALRQAATSNKRADVLVRVLRFGGDVEWVQPTPVPIDEFGWHDIGPAGGGTPLGEALERVAEQMKMPPMEIRGLPPVICVLTDGQPTDDFDRGLRCLLAEPWAQKAVRVCIAIGDDADHAVLRRICGQQGNDAFSDVLQADNAEQLAELVRWASTSAVMASSAPLTDSGVTLAPPELTGPRVF